MSDNKSAIALMPDLSAFKERDFTPTIIVILKEQDDDVVWDRHLDTLIDMFDEDLDIFRGVKEKNTLLFIFDGTTTYSKIEEAFKGFGCTLKAKQASIEEFDEVLAIILSSVLQLKE